MRKLFNDIWVTELKSPDGATAMIADHGAHLLSWIPAGREDALYLSERSQYGGSSAIRGGVPIIFPQFAERGTGKRHGFARTVNWRYEFSGVEQGQALARFCLNHDDIEDNAWPHRFELVYEIAFSGQELHLSLHVHNPSAEAWEFGAALHTYLRIADIDDIGIEGLQGLQYIDQTKSGEIVRQTASLLHIDSEVDRVYLSVDKPVILHDGTRTVTVHKQGFSDVVVWNPGLEKASQLSDMVAHDFHAFVCMEAGAVANPVILGAGQSWAGSQTIRIGNPAIVESQA